MARKKPLYLTLIGGRIMRCLKDSGKINWTNTREYTLAELETELSTGRKIQFYHHVIKDKTKEKPDWYTHIMKGL